MYYAPLLIQRKYFCEITYSVILFSKVILLVGKTQSRRGQLDAVMARHVRIRFHGNFEKWGHAISHVQLRENFIPVKVGFAPIS